MVRHFANLELQSLGTCTPTCPRQWKPWHFSVAHIYRFNLLQLVLAFCIWLKQCASCVFSNCAIKALGAARIFAVNVMDVCMHLRVNGTAIPLVMSEIFHKSWLGLPSTYQNWISVSLGQYSGISVDIPICGRDFPLPHTCTKHSHKPKSSALTLPRFKIYWKPSRHK